MMNWKTWVPSSYWEALKRTGKPPIKTRFVDVDKGDLTSPDVRSRLVAKDFAFKKNDEFFAATPPSKLCAYSSRIWPPVAPEGRNTRLR